MGAGSLSRCSEGLRIRIGHDWEGRVELGQFVLFQFYLLFLYLCLLLVAFGFGRLFDPHLPSGVDSGCICAADNK